MATTRIRAKACAIPVPQRQRIGSGWVRTNKADMKVCVLQPPLRQDDEDPLQAVARVTRMIHTAASESSQDTLKGESYQQSASSTIDLFLLPELSPVGYSEHTFAHFLPTTTNIRYMYQEIDRQIAEAARRVNGYICYGTIGWRETKIAGGESAEHHDDSTTSTYNNNPEYQFFIRQVVVDRQGQQVASYDKIHLCDYGDCAETRFFTPGSVLVSFQIEILHGNNDIANNDDDAGQVSSTVPLENSSSVSTSDHEHMQNVSTWGCGMLICADMRYATKCQSLVRDHKVDVLLQPACFARDISFRTWTSFRETRAVENGVYFVAGNYCGSDFGNSSIGPPWIDEQHEPLVMGTEEGYLVATLKKSALHHARTELPFHRHLMGGQECCTSP